MAEHKSRQFYPKMLVLLLVTLCLSAFLSRMVFERLHEQHFISVVVSAAAFGELDKSLATFEPVNDQKVDAINSQKALPEGVLQQTLSLVKTALQQKLALRFNHKASHSGDDSVAGKGIKPTDSSLPEGREFSRQNFTGLELSLAGPDGHIRFSTATELIGNSIPNLYQTKTLPGSGIEKLENSGNPQPEAKVRFQSGADGATVIIPLAAQATKRISSINSVVISMTAESVSSGLAWRQSQIKAALLRSLAVGLALLVTLAIFGHKYIHSKASHLGKISYGALVLGTAQLTLFLSAWKAIETDLAALSGLADHGTNAQLFTLLSGNITVVLIALLATVELSMLMFVRKNFGEAQALADAATPVTTGYKAMRPAIFLFLFGVDLALSILPLQMERLYEALPGVSREFVLGLPIAVEFLCVGIAIFVSGAWLDRQGWQKPFLVGLLLAASGCIYSWLAPDPIHFILSRAVVGFGYGLTLLAAQGYVVRQTNAKSKSQGLAHLFAGLYSGSICGAATGAMIAERYGYQVVFLGGALFIASVAVYASVILRENRTPASDSMRENSTASHQDSSGSPSVSIWHFIQDRRVIAVTFLSSLPAAIAAIGFLHYFTPVYLSKIGIGESQIGQTLMLFGICLALLGPAISRLADRAQSRKTPIFIGGLLAGTAFLSFAGMDGMGATTLAVILLGLSNSFVLPSQSAYLLQLDISKKLGEGKALGLFRASSRIGQMLGPMVFAAIVSFSDIRLGLILFGVAYLATVILFQILARSEADSPILADNENQLPQHNRSPSESPPGRPHNLRIVES